jgi:hypothetical protein
MRLISRAELLAMPTGTIFATSFGHPCVFEGSLGNDFLENPITEPFIEGCKDSGDIDEVINSGQPFQAMYEGNTGREGLFEDQDYLLYDRADIEQLIAFLRTQLDRAYS